ncbi:MAG: hypothetical protein J6X31_08320, partial [Bacteroidales bacterium]|nr:hypothetical protein [Bacteroidales bacterium]
YYDGKEASVKMPKLYVATQDYLLSGETALLAKIWGMELADIEAEWKNDRPTFKGVTRLDSSNVTLGKEDLMYISTEGVSFDMPVSSTADRWTTNVNTQVDGLCFSTDADGQLADHLNLKTQFEASTNTTFNEFWVRDMLTQINDQKLSGQVHVDMQDTTLLKAEVDATLGATTIEDILALVPAAYKESLKGMNLKSDLSDTRLTANLEVGKELNLKQVKVTSQLNKFQYSDDTNLMCDINTLDATVIYPAGARGKEFRIVGKMNKLDVAMVDDSTNLHVDIPGGTADLLMRDDILNGKDPRLTAQFDLEDFQVKMDDTVQVEIQTPQGKADIDMASVKNCIKVDAKVGLSGLALQMGGGLRGVTGQATADFSCLYDDRQKDVLDQVSPEAKFKLVNGNFNIDGIPYPVELPELNATFNKDKAELSTCQLNLGNSKMSLQGTISNINDWLKEKALLEGKISLSSPLVDVGQLMDLTSGLGCEEDSVAATDAKPTESNAAATSATDTVVEPFLVPKDVNFVITTNIQTAKLNENNFENVNGQLTIDDGVLVLEEMGFTSKAAKMQLTALYKSPRRNNLFVGWNFHLLDIDIAEMIKLVPEIDTIVPMLSSFAGKAEFHLAGETALFADYSPKMSTLQATAAIEGKDLTVLDSETFQTIKKYLFKECTTNKIDTLSVEMAVNRKKMTLYPMLIGWDKYEAVISGNHNITGSMPFNYHISITKCPLVGGHLGLNILGDLDHLDDISFKLGECKYANLYKPEKRRLSQEQTLELKKLINTSLKRMVREE